MRIKVSYLVDSTVVTIEPLDDYTYIRNIKESFQIKKSSILVNSIKAKVVKNYSTSQIFHAFRRAGISEGSIQLEAIGGSSLIRYIISTYISYPP